MDNVVHVSWTGGWDSTFRVLDLLIRHDVIVQPHYVMSPGRRSLRQELKAIQLIGETVRAEFPHIEPRLLPLRLVLLSEIPPNQRITHMFQHIRQRFLVPEQYEWINRYVAACGLDGLEIGMHSDDDTVHSRKLRIVAQPVRNSGGVTTYRLPEEHDDADLWLFRALAVPLIKLRKAEMGDIARDNGFLEILEQSWFCHFPIGDEPCGACHPCRDAHRSSMTHRLSIGARVRYRIWPVLQGVRIVQENPESALIRLKERVRWRDYS